MVLPLKWIASGTFIVLPVELLVMKTNHTLDTISRTIGNYFFHEFYQLGLSSTSTDNAWAWIDGHSL